jgi:hypothetical protein
MRLTGTTLPRVRRLVWTVRKIPVSGCATLTQGQDAIEADACRWMWSASLPTKLKDVVTLLVNSKTRAKAVYIRRLEVRETEVMPLLKRIPVALEIDCRTFTSRVTIPFPSVRNAPGRPQASHT